MIGRFAPTPSGPLHLGSMVTAIASYLDAKQRGGEWLVRIDDLDSARAKIGAVDSILSTLERFGLEWSGSVVYQSNRNEIYLDVLAKLIKTSRCYRCTCTRKDVTESSRLGPDGPIYLGTCRTANHAATIRHAWRVNTSNVLTGFNDRVLGKISSGLESYVGDFVVRRSDLVAGYHLASVVDDHLLGVTDVVRGGDLVPSTLRQVYVSELLSIKTPTFGHVPTIVDEGGRKLSKSNGDLGVNSLVMSDVFFDVLSLLGG